MMKILGVITKSLGLGAMASILWLALSSSANGQSYPTKPIKWIVPYPPGGTTDVVARNIAQTMSEQLGTPIIVENKAGAAGLIGMASVAKAEPDGYTFLVSDASLATAPSLHANMSFDPLKDLIAISLFVTVPHVIVVGPKVDVANLEQLIGLAKKDPQRLYFSSGGLGSPLQLAGEALRYATGIDWVHVPYKGGGPAILAVMSGDAQVAVPSLPSVLPQIQGNKLKALAVTSPYRVAALPTTATVAELGYPKAQAMGWIGLHAPAGTSAAIIKTNEQAALQALKNTELLKRLAEQGCELPANGSATSYQKFIIDESNRWADVVKAANIKAE